MSTNAAVRVGRDGFTGSPITDWCPKCQDWVVRLNVPRHSGGRGPCPWCDHQPLTPEQARAAQREKRRLLNEQRDEKIRGYMARGFSDRQIGCYVGLTHSAVSKRRRAMAATA